MSQEEGAGAREWREQRQTHEYKLLIKLGPELPPPVRQHGIKTSVESVSPSAAIVGSAHCQGTDVVAHPWFDCLGSRKK